MRKLMNLAMLLGCCVALEAFPQGYYLCLDAKTGRKIGQDTPCQPGRELGSYAPVSPEELQARERASRQSKREFERLHPGTYAPDEYMTPEEYTAYQGKLKEREAERRRLADEQALREAGRRAAQAEQRATEAERTAQEAKARATAAEEAAASRPPTILLAPRPFPSLRSNAGCDREDCGDGTRRRKAGKAAEKPGNIPLPCKDAGTTRPCP